MYNYTEYGISRFLSHTISLGYIFVARPHRQQSKRSSDLGYLYLNGRENCEKSLHQNVLLCKVRCLGSHPTFGVHRTNKELCGWPASINMTEFSPIPSNDNFSILSNSIFKGQSLNSSNSIANIVASWISVFHNLTNRRF